LGAIGDDALGESDSLLKGFLDEATPNAGVKRR
jgi:hypothetical protein